MTNQAELINYQATGEIPGLNRASAAAANEAIAIARNATPQALRPLYRSYIRRDGAFYVWGWVLRD